jgi:hypothetical protein
LGKSYKLSISGITDTRGKPLPTAEIRFSLDPSPDEKQPSIVKTTPAHYTPWSGLYRDPIYIHYSEPVRVIGSDENFRKSITIRKAGGSSSSYYPATAPTTEYKNGYWSHKLIWDYTFDQSPGIYIITINNGKITDLNNNFISNGYYELSVIIK